MNFRNKFQLTSKTWVMLFFVALLLWWTIKFFNLFLEIGAILFAAYLLSLAMRPLATPLYRWHIPRAVTAILIYLAVGGILVGLGLLITPVVINEYNYLHTHGVDFFKSLFTQMNTIPIIKQNIPSANSLAQTLGQRLDSILSTVFSTAAGIGGFALDLLIVLILGFFFTSDPDILPRMIRAWVPLKNQERTLKAANAVIRRLTHWVWSQLAVAVYFIVAFSVGLTLLGVPFGLSIGLVGGVLEVIPYLGGVIALFLAILSGLTVSPWMILWVFLLYLGVVEIESHIIMPMLYGQVLHLHPVLMLIVLLVGAKFYGVPGVLFAVPISVVLVSFLDELRSMSGNDYGGEQNEV